MRFMYQYPEVTSADPDMLDCGPVGEVAVAAERAGWHGLAFTEHPIPGANWLASGGHQSLDPFVALGHAAAVTTHLRLLTFLAVAPYRNPSLLAKAAATVDKLSNGRFILGMGTGYHKTEFHALGVDFDERNTLFDEALDVLPLHWSGERFSYEGLHFRARDVQARPRPVQVPIPIWIGGNSKLTLRRVAERAQGWMPLTGSPELSVTTRTPHLGSMDELAEKIASTRAAAGDRGAELDVLWAYRDPSVVDTGVEADRHREAFAALEAIGVTWVLLSPTTTNAEATFGFLESFGATYLR